MLAVALLLVAACVAWSLWPVGSAGPSPPPAVAPPPTPAPVAGPSPPSAPAEPEAPFLPPKADPWLLAEAEAERLCPWPPDPLSWQVLGAPCLAVMDSIMMDEDWRTALADPLGDRRAVGVALEQARCRVPPPVDVEGNLAWPGEVRADLRETCAAGAMVRLAKLLELCIVNAHRDWTVAFELSEHVRLNSFGRRPKDDMTLYHREVKDDNHGYARVFWKVYRCRSVPLEALEWVDALPLPPLDLSAIPPAMLNTDPRGVSQIMHLYEAARRLGWEFPPGRDDMLRRFAARQLEPEPDLPPSVSDNHQFPDNWPRGDRHR